MGYVGTAPLSGDYRKLDDISGTFDGNETEFALTVSTVAVTPPKETTLLISVGGILQEPVSAYTLSGSTITFTAAPESGADFFGVMLGEATTIGTPSDGTISAAKVENTFISGQTEITSGLAAADELLYSDGGTIKKVGLDTLADKLAGTNITASAGVLSSADTNTTYTGGTNLTLSTTTFNVDDAFLTNTGDDATSGTITMAHLIVGDAGNIGSASDTDAIAISSGGVVTFSQQAVFSKDIFIDSTPADTAYSGITASFTAGEALDVGEVVYLNAADSRVWKAVSVVSGTGLISAEIMCMGMVAVAQASAGSAVTILLQGFLQHQTNFPTYAVGETLYVPEAEVGGFNVPEGVSPDTTGDFVQVIGWAAGADTVYFNPDFTIIEHA